MVNMIVTVMMVVMVLVVIHVEDNDKEADTVL